MDTRMWQARRQAGGVAITVALSMFVLVGFLALVIDLGRMYVVKTELQNAADACALAAAIELDGNTDALTRAENAGITIGARNLIDFQSTPLAVSADDIKFSTALSSPSGDNSNYLTQAAGAPIESRYAMCTVTLPSLPMTFASVLGIGARTVAAQAVATLAPAQSNCALPMGICSKGPGSSFGMNPGDWLQGRFDAGGGMTGSFNWIDFTPPGGGQSELAGLLTNSGTCNVTPGPAGTLVGQSGIMGNAAARAWNTRFGLYQGGGPMAQPENGAPDYSGYAYTPSAWPQQRDALADFLNPHRANHAPYQGDAATGLRMGGGYNALSPSQHATYGANRRLAVAPVVNCADWASSQTVAIQGYACVFMLHPIGSPQDNVYLEYVGPADDPLSPCATIGLAGGSNGPLVPVLVQ